MTRDELRAAYQADFATAEASFFWLRLTAAQRARTKALALFTAQATDAELDKLLALVATEGEDMAGTRKLTSANDLSDSQKQALTAAGIDWAAVLAKLGPLALQVFQILLALAASVAPPKKAARAVKAGCCDHSGCCKAALESSLETTALIADHLCQCCEEPA